MAADINEDDLDQDDMQDDLDQDDMQDDLDQEKIDKLKELEEKAKKEILNSRQDGNERAFRFASRALSLIESSMKDYNEEDIENAKNFIERAKNQNN